MNHIGAQKKKDASLHAHIKQEKMKVSYSPEKYTLDLDILAAFVLALLYTCTVYRQCMNLLVDQCSFSVP